MMVRIPFVSLSIITLLQRHIHTEDMYDVMAASPACKPWFAKSESSASTDRTHSTADSQSDSWLTQTSVDPHEADIAPPESPRPGSSALKDPGSFFWRHWRDGDKLPGNAQFVITASKIVDGKAR
jgi:hypothetical protein